MERTEAQSDRMARCGRGRGNGRISNRHLLNALLSGAEHGARGVPARVGRGTPAPPGCIAGRRTGGLAQVCKPLRKRRLVRIKLEAGARDRTSVQSHSDGSTKEPGPPSLGQSCGAPPPSPKISLGAAAARTAGTFSLTPRRTHATPAGRKLLHSLGGQRAKQPILMDRAWEGNKTCPLALKVGVKPVGHPLRNRHTPRGYERELDKRRTEDERRLQRLTGLRRRCSRLEKREGIFLGFIVFALIFDALW